MEAVTAVRYEKSAILREGLGARIGGGTPEEGPLLRPNSFFHFILSGMRLKIYTLYQNMRKSLATPDWRLRRTVIFIKRKPDEYSAVAEPPNLLE